MSWPVNRFSVNVNWFCQIGCNAETGWVLDTRVKLDRFFAEVEKRAFRMAQLATRDTEEALDLVQDSMLTLVKRYGDRGEGEWPALFHRILQNRIRDWYRRQKVKSKLFGWVARHVNESEPEVEQFPDGSMMEPDARLANSRVGQELQQVLQQLPLRQQQVFLLRILEGLDVKQTANAMGISTGSVKTHFSRAVRALREKLEDHVYE